MRLSFPRGEEDELDGVGDEPRDVAEHEQHHHQDRRLGVTGVSLLLDIGQDGNRALSSKFTSSMMKLLDNFA